MLTTFKHHLYLALPLLLLAGCFETELSLGPVEKAKVYPKLIGEWHVTWKADDKTESAELLVANFNGREYFAEWKPEGEKMARINAYTIDVKGATFVQLTGIGDDLQPEEKHVIARIEIKDDKLVIRQLNEDFFKEVKTDADLQKRVAENLDNKEIYAEEMIGTKKVSN